MEATAPTGEEPQVEQLLLTIREVFVYKLPPLRTSSGYRAEEWDLANPLITGVLRVYQKDEELFLRIFEPKRKQDDVMVLGLADMDLELFAECPIHLDEARGKTLSTFVDTVIDSSRYFVVRCQDRNSKRHAQIGMGFRDRQCAFDLKATLHDFVRFVERSRAAERIKAGLPPLPSKTDDTTIMLPPADSPGLEDGEEEEGEGGHGGGAREAGGSTDATTTPPSSVPVDLRLKEGEKLRLNVRAFDSSHKHKQAAAGSSSKLPHPPAEGGGFGALLPPPPKAGPPAAISPLAPPPQHSPAKAAEGSTEGSGQVEQGQKQEEDDWGDFTSASPTT